MDPKNPFHPYNYPDGEPRGHPGERPVEHSLPDSQAPSRPGEYPSERRDEDEELEDERGLAPASEWELRQEAPPSRADASDLMSRRLSGLFDDPEKPSNIAPRLEGEDGPPKPPDR